MTKLLEQALDKVRELPEAEQDQIADEMLRRFEHQAPYDADATDDEERLRRGILRPKQMTAQERQEAAKEFAALCRKSPGPADLNWTFDREAIHARGDLS